MSLVRYNPFGIRSLNQFVDDFFNGGLTDVVGSDASFNMPSVNVVESKENFRIEVAAPGLEKKDFDLKVDNGMLTISAKREHREEVKEEGKFMRREFNFATFSRSFTLPENVKAEDIVARYDNGVLYITLPKVEKARVEDTHIIEIQ